MRTLLATIILLGLAATTAQAQEKAYELSMVCNCSYTIDNEPLIQNIPAYGLVQTSKSCFEEYSQLNQECIDAQNTKNAACSESSNPTEDNQCLKASNDEILTCYEASSLRNASSCAGSKAAAEANARLNCKEVSNDKDAASSSCSAIVSQSK